MAIWGERVRSPERTALRVAIMYGSVAVVWILVTGWLAGALPEPVSHDVEYAKGLFFVGVTSVALFFIIRSWSRRYVSEAGRANEARHNLERVLEMVPMGIVIVDRDGLITRVNPTAGRMLNLSSDEAVGANLRDLCRPTGPADEFDLDGLLASGAASGLELCSAEATRAVVATSAPLDESRPADGWVVALADMTQEHLEHDRFRRLMNGYRFVAEASAIANRTSDEEQLLRDVCDLAVRVGGYPGAVALSIDPSGGEKRLVAMVGLNGEAQSIARRLVDARTVMPAGHDFSEHLGEREIVIHNDLAHDLVNPWSSAADEGLASSATFSSARPGGDIVSITLFGPAPGFFDQDQYALLGALRSAIGFALEKLSLDARRLAAEEALELSERNYRQLFDSNPMPMWIYDRETLRFLAVNERALAKYGYTREQFLAMTVLDIRPAEEVAAFTNSLSARGHENGIGFWTHRDSNGRTFPVHILSHPMEWQGREAVVVMAEEVARVEP